MKVTATACILSMFAMVLFAAPKLRAQDAGVVVDASSAPDPTDAGPMEAVSTTPDAPAPSEEGPSTTLPREMALVRERPTPLGFRISVGGRDARARADAAGAALRAALDAPAVEGAPVARVRVEGDAALVEVRGRAVATITRGDAAAEAATIETYAALLETRLISFVNEELERSSYQSLALRIFLSVVFVLLALFTLRALRGAFERWEKSVETSAPEPLTVLGMPFLSSDARRGLVAVALVAGRVLSSIAVLVVLFGAILGQFDATRPLLARAGATAVAPVLRGADALVSAVPGILLAITLVVATRALLRFAELLLDGVAQGRVSASWLGPARVAPARALVRTGGVLVMAPLVAAAAFGQFGSPFEHLSVVAAGCVCLACVPPLASAAAGFVVLWRGGLAHGDWIEIGSVRGEVTSVRLLDVVVAAESGDTVSVPMLTLAVVPLRRRPIGHATLVVEVKRDRPVLELEQALLRAACEVAANGAVDLVDVRGNALRVALRVGPNAAGGRGALVRAVALAAERGEFALVDDSPSTSTLP